MNARLTTMERAFELARSGELHSVADIVRQLNREGFSPAQISGPLLMRQLREIMQAARGVADASVERWENEGGSAEANVGKTEYGRRVESDRSWTVYHVYTGVPGHIDGEALTGLSRGRATEILLALNNVPTCRSQR